MPLGTGTPNELTASAEIVFESVTAARPAAQPSIPQPKRSMQTRATQTPIKPPSVAPLEVADAQTPTRPSNVAQAGVPDTAITVPHPDAPSRGVLAPAIAVRAVPVSWSRHAWPFFKLGMYHIATGWDHLMFLLGLLLLCQPFSQLIKVVTAFTLAHSATLALAANGLITPPGSWVEPAIAL
ncbi:MAG: HupE/UreJ family protein, partial [Nitrospirales bacterium]|nr:HupE/UreJ family protein [Nitrospirales bacterium]